MYHIGGVKVDKPSLIKSFSSDRMFGLFKICVIPHPKVDSQLWLSGLLKECTSACPCSMLCKYFLH